MPNDEVVKEQELSDSALHITTEELRNMTPERRDRLHQEIRNRLGVDKVSLFINTLADLHQTNQTQHNTGIALDRISA